jgi:hypothetical protein
MKKIVKNLGLVLVLGMVLVSCSSNDDDDDNTVVSEKNLIGTYKITQANVEVAVDLNDDGVKDISLLRAGYKACEMDDYIKIDKTNFTILKNGKSCFSGEVDEIYNYKNDSSSKTLTVLSTTTGKVIYEYKDVTLIKSSEMNALLLTKYDEDLEQNVYFTLTEI